MLKKTTFLLVIGLLALTAHATPTASWSVNAQLRNYLAGFLGTSAGAGTQAFCVAIINSQVNSLLTDDGLVIPTGSAIFCDGETRPGNGVRPDGNTFFLIGSVTKTFVAALLADDVLAGRRAYTDLVVDRIPVSLRPSGWGSPGAWRDYAGKSHAKLIDLATFTSGLERLGRTVPATGSYGEPYRVSDLLGDFMGDKLAVSPGTWLYSNLAYELLSYAVTGSSWHTRLHDEILVPLGMNDTGIRVGPNDLPRLAVAANGDEDLPLRTWSAGLGSGGLYSTASDMMTYLAWHMGRGPHILPCASYGLPSCGAYGNPFAFGTAAPDDLDPIVNETMRPRTLDDNGYQQGMGWLAALPSVDPVSPNGAFLIAWKDGGDTVGSSHYTARLEIAIRADGSRSTGVFAVTVGSDGGVAEKLARNIVAILEPVP